MSLCIHLEESSSKQAGEKQIENWNSLFISARVPRLLNDIFWHVYAYSVADSIDADSKCGEGERGVICNTITPGTLWLHGLHLNHWATRMPSCCSFVKVIASYTWLTMTVLFFLVWGYFIPLLDRELVDR